MHIGVVGSGYVGLVTGTCLAHLGHEATCVDKDVGRIRNLQKGIVPIYEQGLEGMLQDCLERGYLTFGSSLQEAVQGKEFIFIAVGTPSGEDGRADLSQVEEVVKSPASLEVEGELFVVIKSTVPVGTCRKVKRCRGKFPL